MHLNDKQKQDIQKIIESRSLLNLIKKLTQKIHPSIKYSTLETIDHTESEVEYYEESPSVRFLLFHDVLERLMYILTGFENRFFSSYYVFAPTKCNYVISLLIF